MEDLEYEISKYRPITLEKIAGLFEKVVHSQIKKDVSNIENLIRVLDVTKDAVGKRTSQD